VAHHADPGVRSETEEVEMQFQPRLMDAILDGRKTVTRRMVRLDKTGEAKPSPYRIGNVYQATDRPRWARGATNESEGWRSVSVKVVSIRPELLSEIDEREAVREGFVAAPTGLSARDQFLILWGKFHGLDPEDPDCVVWRIEFARVPGSWRKK